MDVEVPSDAEDDSDVEESSFYAGNLEDSFTKESISNDPNYLRMVRRCLVDNFYAMERPTPALYEQFLNHRQKLRDKALKKMISNEYGVVSAQFAEEVMTNLKSENVYAEPDVNYDAWCCVTARCRSLFNSKLLIQKYPSLKEKIKYLRAAMNITV